MRDLKHRGIGLTLLVASGGSTLGHRQIYEAARHGPAHPLEFAFGLLTFILASTGILLLIHGSRLFEPATARRAQAPTRRSLDRGASGDPTGAQALDTYHGVTRQFASSVISAATERNTARPEPEHGGTEASRIPGPIQRR